jgi:hypothetical protein
MDSFGLADRCWRETRAWVPEGAAMTEAEWLASDDPIPMLNNLGNEPNDRKMRLFACACCRRVWGWIPNPDERAAVEVAERFTDGQATLEERRATLELIYFASGSGPALYASHSDLDDPRYTFSADVFGTCTSAQELAKRHRGSPDQEKPAQADLLRCVFGLIPFRPAAVDPALLTPTVLALAQAAYDERLLPSGELERVRLAVLADALQDAGCDDPDILSHCRDDGPHVRGCWVIDLVLGKS